MQFLTIQKTCNMDKFHFCVADDGALLHCQFDGRVKDVVAGLVFAMKRYPSIHLLVKESLDTFDMLPDEEEMEQCLNEIDGFLNQVKNILTNPQKPNLDG